MSAGLIALLQILLQNAASIGALFGKTGQTVATDVQVADQIALAVLQQNAAIKGQTIDWSDAAAVQAYVQTLPGFTPIPNSPSALSAG